jgi:signal transduction histidine kinase
MDSLIHPDDRERVREALNRAASYGQQYDVEYRVVHADGREGWVSAKGRAQHDATGAMVGTYGVVQDITEKRHLEDELRRRAQELADADRKKDDFIALLAHELRNPLAPVRTGLQVMRLAADDADAVARTRNVMDRQIAHMARLIDDLLDVSRINRNKLTLRKAPIALSEIVNHAVETVRPAVDAAGHTLEVSLPSAPVVLDADLTRMAQVFGNLLTNSAKYTEPGGHIRLSAELRGGQVVVSVQDNGIGIPADSLDRVFDMFSQVDQSIGRAGGGLGIGLALVKGLVESHAGTVTVSSGGVGQGEYFHRELARAIARARGCRISWGRAEGSWQMACGDRG